MKRINGQIYFELFISFFKIGFLAFGGGYAVIPLLQREIVAGRRWITNEELSEAMGISQTFPGIIFVNSATLIGCRVAGFWGAAIATTAAIAPTFILTLLITVSLWKYTEFAAVKKIFSGVLLGVAALVGSALLKMWSGAVQNGWDLFGAVGAAFLLIVLKINAALVIIGVAILGFVYRWFSRAKGV